MVIYLHGFASGPGSKKAQYFRRCFSDAGVELLIPDLAEGDFEHLTITGQLAVVERLAAGRPVTLIGSSMGGYLAALYAARHPETERVVLLAPAFAFPTRWPESLGPEIMASWRKTGWMRLFHYGDGQERNLTYGLIEDGSRYEDFPAFTQPGLIFHGRNDTVVPSIASEHFAASRPNVRLQILDSDHELADVLPYLWNEMREFVL